MRQSQIMFGAVVGAIVGAAAGYLFFSEHGRELREKMEPTIDEMRREFARFQKTIEKVGELANDGLRVVNEFNQARAQVYPTTPVSH